MPVVRFASCWCHWIVWLLMVSGVGSIGSPLLTEFLASNSSRLADEDGEFSDWIEIYNPDATAISLQGYHLTDNAEKLGKWTFPNVTLAPGAYLVVFASGKDRSDPARPLHTDFQLSADGEYLALVAPDGLSVLSEYAPFFPPQSENVSFGVASGNTETWAFFSTPTPGAVNSIGTRAGPTILPLEKNPPQPTAGPLTLRAEVRPVNGPVAEVKLYYRKMFNAEAALDMRDDGTGGDQTPGDGIWTGVIPESALAPGQMTRWRFTAADDSGTESKEPPYRDVRDSEQYYGTVARDPEIRSALPVIHWFASNPGGAGTTSGSRGSVYYDGEFYDNVLFSLHGQSSSGFPKKSYNIDFNRTRHFQWSTNAPRVADIDLITNWADKSKVRHVLAYEVMRESGVAAHFAYTVRVQQNGNFFSTADIIEDADETYLERAGLNPDGALYKVYDNLLNKDAGDTGNAGVEKKTRKTENNSDLQALINGLDLTGSALVNYLYDNINIPACVNMLAANSVIRNIDMHSKNWYIYRDTGLSDEWFMLPWDLDLSHGRVWNQQNTYFDNALYTDGFVVNGTSIRLPAQLFANPSIRSMIMRRIRTLSDRFLQPPPAPGTPENELYYERRLNEQSALIDPPDIVPSDARLDFEKWGSWLQGGTKVSYTNPNAAVETMAEAIQRWKSDYLPRRRSYIYNTQIVGKGGEIPLPQTGGLIYNYTPLLVAGAPAKVFVPANGDLGATWIGISSREPFDTSAWKTGVTGVGYERASGYQSLIGTDVNSEMQSNNSVYIRIEFDVSDPNAIERLELRMKYDDGFVAFLNGTVLASANAPVSLQWNAAATRGHEANAVTDEVFDVTAKKSALKVGRNILAIQGLNDTTGSSDMLIMPELYSGAAASAEERQPQISFGVIEPSPASGNQDEEYIQLLNPNSIAVDISDWKLSGGVEHTFAPGTVLPPNGKLYLSPNVTAFRARTVSPKGGEGLFIQGGYKGHLSSRGETLTLLDATGTTNKSATYQGSPSDAQRNLTVSEVMYNPAGDGDAEFIELLNTSTSVTLDLTDVRFTEGVLFNFAGSAITSLPPQKTVLVVRDLAAFNARYGGNLPVAGVFTNGDALSNGGEHLKLEDGDNGTIQEFTYDDELPWPLAADGLGYSLVLIAPERAPDASLATNWRLGTRPGGTPGSSDVVPYPANPLADADGNGEADLLDYALGNNLGLSPIPAAFSVQSDSAGGAPSMHLTYPVSIGADRAQIEVLFSSDLVKWENGGLSLEAASVEPLGDGRAMVNWRVKTTDGEPRRFMRFRVTAK